MIPAAHRFHPVNLDLWGVASRPLVVCGSSGGGGSSLLLLSPATLTFVPRILRLAILIQVCVLALLRLKITVARVSGSGIMGMRSCGGVSGSWRAFVVGQCMWVVVGNAGGSMGSAAWGASAP